MDILKTAENLMSMDESAWQKHASPLSVYSRFTIVPLFTATLALREVLGWWTLLILLLVSFWTWLNPRIFKAPKKTNNWASMGTFGERIYLNRHNENRIPFHHLQMCRNIMALQIIGVPFWIYSIYTMSLGFMILSMLWLMFTKMWFVDRMVWVYQDMKESNPVYQSWLKS